MKYKDRKEIIEQLQDMFNIEEVRENRLITETIRMDNHNIARVTKIKYSLADKDIYVKYPEIIPLRDIEQKLNTSHDGRARNASRKLKNMLVQADKENKMSQMVDLCRDFESRMYSVSYGSAQYDLVLCYIIDKIAAVQI